jgi:transcriptional regulator with XRE-family HTH domain
MTTRVRLYRTYSFKNRDPILDTMHDIAGDVSRTTLAKRSGVSAGTYSNWWSPNGKTKRPQYATVVATLRALGHDVRIVDKSTYSGRLATERRLSA